MVGATLSHVHLKVTILQENAVVDVLVEATAITLDIIQRNQAEIHFTTVILTIKLHTAKLKKHFMFHFQNCFIYENITKLSARQITQ